jgi:hypothetical protein
VAIQPLIERLHYPALFWSTFAVIATAAVGWWLGRCPKKVPDLRQAAAEILVERVAAMCRAAFGPVSGRMCVAFLGTLLMLSVVCNMLAMVPLSSLTLGVITADGVELSGDEYMDFNDNHVWEPGEPMRHGEVVDWTSAEHERGFLLPSVKEGVAGANLLMQLSMEFALAALTVVWVALLARAMADGANRHGWYAWPILLAYHGVRVLASALGVLAIPLGGIAVAVIAGGIVYNVLLVFGVSHMTELGVGLLEVVIVAFVVRRRRVGGEAAVKPAVQAV